MQIYDAATMRLQKQLATNQTAWQECGIFSLVKHWRQSKTALQMRLGMTEENNFSIEVPLPDRSEESARSHYCITAKWLDELYWTVPNSEVLLSKNRVRIGNMEKSLTRDLAKKMREHNLEFPHCVVQELDKKHELKHSMLPRIGEIAGVNRTVVFTTDLARYFNAASPELSFTSCASPGGTHYNTCSAWARDRFTILAFMVSDGQIVGRTTIQAYPEKLEYMVGVAYGLMPEPDRLQIGREFGKIMASQLQREDEWARQNMRLDPYRIQNASSQNFQFEAVHGAHENYAVYADTDWTMYAWGSQRELMHPVIKWEQAICLSCGKETSRAARGGCHDCGDLVDIKLLKPETVDAEEAPLAAIPISRANTSCNQCLKTVPRRTTISVGIYSQDRVLQSESTLCKQCTDEQLDAGEIIQCQSCYGWFDLMSGHRDNSTAISCPLCATEVTQEANLVATCQRHAACDNTVCM